MKYPGTVFGIKDTTKSFVQYLPNNVCKVDLVVPISPGVTSGAVISSHSPMGELTAQGIEVFETDAYALDDERASRFFSQNEFGIGISMNWSRLIPESILDRFEAGVFGLHGSCGYLPFGQGHANLNWSLIRGDWRYVMHLFKLDKFPDAPNIYGKEMFEVHEHDDIRTLQYKDLIVSRNLVAGLLKDYKDCKPIVTTFADNDVKEWYKRRRPEDGRVDITARTRDIYNLVRSVTHPFPGAFAFVNSQRVMLWKARPFDKIIDFSAYKLGEIMDIFDENLLVRTVDGSLLITEYECDAELNIGDVFE
jgi:methionyl-tRNA formyltransferase